MPPGAFGAFHALALRLLARAAGFGAALGRPSVNARCERAPAASGVTACTPCSHRATVFGVTWRADANWSWVSLSLRRNARTSSGFTPGTIRVGYTVGNPSGLLSGAVALEFCDVEMVPATASILAGLKLAAAYPVGERIGRAPEALCRLFGRQCPDLLDDRGQCDRLGRNAEGGQGR